MKRRNFVGSSAALAGLALLPGRGLRAQTMGTQADPDPIGVNKFEAVFRSERGNVVAMDSLLYIYDDNVTVNDVVVSGSYCGDATLPHAVRKGVKAMIAHDAGVGRDRAGISALPAGDRHAIPVAAVQGMTASISNGRSMMDGVISHANDLAKALGVRPGQPVAQAAQLLLGAAPGTPSELELPLDKTLYPREVVGKVQIVASSALTNLDPKADNSNIVIAWGAHSGAVAAVLVKRWNVRAWIGNDAGMAKNNTGIAALPLCNDLGIPCAAVSTMSARIGDGQSTYDDGIISAVNDLAQAKGLREGMPAAEAARLLAL